ncbi:MAG: response regulator transcription factor [Armatimonadetes bacterium]|nr:response regulator transcription factor [Armatimonadota bacterium]
MERKLAILVVDSHPIVRWALKEFLTDRPNIELVMEADSVGQAVSVINTRKPDVVITELVFSDSDGLDAVQELVKNTSAGIIAFSDHDAWDQVERFLDSGGMGFVSKRSALTELATAIKAVACKQKWIAPSVRSAVPSRRKIGNEEEGGLTDREREIVALITKGFTSKQIADQLCLSIKTVETHRYRVFKKLKIGHCAQLADYAIRHGISHGPRHTPSGKPN